MRTDQQRLLLLSLLCGSPLTTACREPASTGTVSPDDTTTDGGDDTGPGGGDDTGAGDDTGSTAPDWVALGGACEAPSGLAAQPLVQLGEDQHTQDRPGEWFVELVDLEISADGQTLWAAGQGGVMAYDIGDVSEPSLYTYFPRGGGIGRFYRVELLDDLGLVYATHRDQGLAVLDADLDSLEQRGFVPGAGMEGMARVGDRLYVVSLYGDLLTFDLTDPVKPAQIDAVSWAGSGWDIVVDAAAGVGYIPDNTLGLVPVDLSDPDAPVLGTPVDLGGGAQDVALGDGVLYVAAGGRGVITLDRAGDPLAPVVLDTLEVGGSVQSVALDGSVLWAVNQEDVIALDVASPEAPMPLSTVETAEFAMHVAARDGVAWVGDWSRLGSWMIDTTAPAPDLDLAAQQLYLSAEGEVALLTVRNTGAAPLSLLGAASGDDRLSVRASPATLAPGEAGWLEITFSGGTELLTSLCVVSNDPDTPTALIEVHTGEGGQNPAIGEAAPDFALTDLDGNTRQLSEELGHPVVLAYFATW